jgi:hypothetical protein
VNIPTVFARNAGEGERAWRTLLSPVLQRPRLAPILDVFPGEIQPGLLARATAWDAEHRD